MRRKPAIFALLFSLLLALTACAGSNTPSSESTPSPEVNTGASLVAPENTSSPAPSGDASDGENILIAYFSYTGNTEEVAQQIATLTGGTLAQIQRATEYENLQEEAEAEIQNDIRPEITVNIDGIENYDTIFVGYPIWWEEAPAMIATFLESYDFSGKTLIPFCTSASDPIENSLHIFREICPEATLAEGLTANNPAEIEPWLGRLGLRVHS